MSPDLTDAEINEICDGLVRNSAKVRFLERMGLTVRLKPNGKPLVNRNHYDIVMNGRLSYISKTKNTANEPNWSVKA